MTKARTGAINTREVPEKARLEFKTKCAEKGITMQDAVLQLVLRVNSGNVKLRRRKSN